MAGKRLALGFIISLILVVSPWASTQVAQAACGAVSCFNVQADLEQSRLPFDGNEPEISRRAAVLCSAFRNHFS